MQDFFLKSKGKEVERKTKKMKRDGCLLVNICLGVEIFLSRVEIFLGGVEKFSGGGGVEKSSGGLRNFRGGGGVVRNFPGGGGEGFRIFQEGLRFFGRS